MIQLHSLDTLTSLEIILMVSLLFMLYLLYSLYLKYRTLRCEFIKFSDSMASSLEVLQEDAIWSIKEKVKQVLILNGKSESDITEEDLNDYVLDSIRNVNEEWSKAIDYATTNMRRNGIKPLNIDDKSWILSNFYK